MLQRAGMQQNRTLSFYVVWTQEMTDEIVAENERILEDIKNGVLVSKSVDGGISAFSCSAHALYSS